MAKKRKKRKGRRREERASVVAAWCTPTLAMQMSGHLRVVLAARLGPERSAWAYASSSLLAGGYIETTAAATKLPVERLLAFDVPFRDAPGGLRRVDVHEASELLWGCFAWTWARDATSAIAPAFGWLARPDGEPEDWECAFESHFSEHQLALAEKATLQGQSPRERREISAEVVFMIEPARPIAFATEIARHAHEFSYDSARALYLWRSPDGLGSFHLRGNTIAGVVQSSEAAAVLASRLSEISPCALTLVKASFVPEEAETPQQVATLKA